MRDGERERERREEGRETERERGGREGREERRERVKNRRLVHTQSCGRVHASHETPKRARWFGGGVPRLRRRRPEADLPFRR